MILTLSELYKVFGKKMAVKDAKIKGICTDTRKLKKGEVFFALIGETNGHKYAGAAFKSGAAAVVVEKYVKGIDEKFQVKVKDTTKALLKLAEYYFKKFGSVKAVAVTGSNGKTTTKELLAAMLSQKYTTLKSEKSFNNNIGLPHTVFNLGPEHEAVVFELGMNHKGEIKNLVSAIRLDAAIITNVGRAHVGFFKDGVKGIANAKAEIMQGIKNGGVVVLNKDDKFFEFLTGKAVERGRDRRLETGVGKDGNLKVKTFGVVNDADVKVESYGTKGGRTMFKVNCVKPELSMSLKGEHNLSNAAAAIAAAKTFGVSDAGIKKALLKFRMEGFMRFEEVKLGNGITAINDCYNANPDSFKASIETLKKMGTKGLVVLMGDMLELGKDAKKFHEETGKRFAGLNIKKFLIYGKHAEDVKKGYGQKAETFKDREELKNALKLAVKPGDTVFVKGSRGNKLEEIIKVLK